MFPKTCHKTVADTHQGQFKSATPFNIKEAISLVYKTLNTHVISRIFLIEKIMSYEFNYPCKMCHLFLET